MAKTIKNIKTSKKSDPNLALVSIILGAASFFNTFFTGIPAVIVGIIALRRNAGDRTQAKLGIVFGILGCLLIIPIMWAVFHFFGAPIREQGNIPDTDRTKIQEIVKELKSYQKSTGKLPQCNQVAGEVHCPEWTEFAMLHSDLISYPVEFEADSYGVEDRGPGTLVYASKTSCFINTPAAPGVFEEKQDNIKTEDYSALIYYHANGKSCFPVTI